MNSRDEFLARRKTGLGGSDIGAILNLSKFKSAVDVFLDKTGRTKPTPSTIAQRFGIYAEEFVAQEYTAKTGRQVVRYNPQLSHPDYPFLIGNVDRLVIPEGAKVAAHIGKIRTDRGMEAKAVSAYGASEWGDDDSDEVPPYYLTQCAWYRILTGCIHWDLAALIGNSRVEIYTLSSDTELEELLVARAVEFWNNHILKDIPPPPRSEADIAALYPKSEEGRKVLAGEAELMQVAALKSIREKLADLEKQEENCLVSLKGFMQSADALVLAGADGKPLATWKSNKTSVKTDYESAYGRLLALAKLPNAADIHKILVAENTTTKNGARPFKLK